MYKNLKGVYAVVITPFNEKGDFDVPAAKNHLDWLICNGIKGVCILGATGEYLSITDEEHMDYVKEIVPYVKDRVSVLVGVSRERPEDVVKLMNNAKKVGADAAMALPPYYCHPSQQEIVEFYKYLNENSDLPFIVYNNPHSAGVEIAEETYKEVLKLSKAKLVKESSGQIQRLTEVLFNAPEDTTILCGCDNMSLESLAVGAHGWISMAANFAPKDCAALYENVVEQGDIKRGKDIYKRLLPALNVLETFDKPVQAIKCVLNNAKGINAGFVRKPRVELTKEEVIYVLGAMKADQVQ